MKSNVTEKEISRRQCENINRGFTLSLPPGLREATNETKNIVRTPNDLSKNVTECDLGGR